MHLPGPWILLGITLRRAADENLPPFSVGWGFQARPAINGRPRKAVLRRYFFRRSPKQAKKPPLVCEMCVDDFGFC